MNVVSLLVANREPAVLGKPSQCALHHPPVSPQFLGTLHSFSGYATFDAPFSQSSCTLFVVIGFVGMQLLGTLPRSSGTATSSLDGFNGIQKILENHRVVHVGPTCHYRERDTFAVDHNMALRSRFSFIRWIRTGSCSPLFAETLAESKEARSQSICSTSPRRSRRTRCSFFHTPASCHSFKRRQQVMPLPQPISWGSISHGMPLFSTKMMPARAARSSMRGLPPSGLGGSSGNSGSIIFQSSSLTNSLAMFLTYPHSAVLKEALRAIFITSDGQRCSHNV